VIHVIIQFNTEYIFRMYFTNLSGKVDRSWKNLGKHFRKGLSIFTHVLGIGVKMSTMSTQLQIQTATPLVLHHLTSVEIPIFLYIYNVAILTSVSMLVTSDI